MTLQNTRTTELGSEVAASAREITGRVTAGKGVAAYIYGENPFPWSSVRETGWDLVGTRDSETTATLRDLVEIVGAWGETPLATPLVPTLLIKRHVPALADHDGPLTFALRTRTSTTGWAPFGAVANVQLLRAVDTGELTDPQGTPDDYDPVLLGADVPVVTAVTTEFAREVAVLAAAEASGAARRIVRDAVAFTRGREQFGRPIGSFQAVKHHMANAHMATESAETAAIWASLDESAGPGAIRASLENSRKAVELSLQVHGGLGFTWEMGVHVFLRHVTTLSEVAEAAIASAWN